VGSIIHDLPELLELENEIDRILSQVGTSAFREDLPIIEQDELPEF
jgi:hypothetical protein